MNKNKTLEQKIKEESRFIWVAMRIMSVMAAMLAFLLVFAVIGFVTTDYWGDLWWIGLLGLSGAGLAVVFDSVARVFRDVRRGESPFTLVNANRLKRISVVLLITTLSLYLYQLILSVAGVYNDGLVMMFTGIAYALFSGVVGGIALIFQYGVQLQEQADETL
ncbi:MAG: hypothetical protein FWH20_00215 [Oscillospiraceae bacterium]|nr:hypothetical protein [Oscillospiraceae bacterium]